jgi:hypothetical protein
MDGIVRNQKTSSLRYRPSFEGAQELLRSHRSRPFGSVLFSRGKVSRAFFTDDSKRYVSAYEADLMCRGMVRYAAVGRFDSVHMRFVSANRACLAQTRRTGWAADPLYARLRQEYFGFRNSLAHFSDMLASGISPAKVWNASIVTAIFFGMFSMTLIYRYLGQHASAEDIPLATANMAAVQTVEESRAPAVLGAATEAAETPKKDESAVREDSYTAQLMKASAERKKQEDYEEEIRRMVKGYPIEKMLPYIVKKDRTVAAFLIGIAKKESNWGKRVPVLHGKDCYNYWGYRGIREKMGTDGHTCFDSPKDAVDTVASRIERLVKEEKLATPAEMVVWKCGYSCAGHSRESVRKWISDVDMYFQELK